MCAQASKGVQDDLLDLFSMPSSATPGAWLGST
jgi:hypothetical protein